MMRWRSQKISLVILSLIAVWFCWACPKLVSTTTFDSQQVWVVPSLQRVRKQGNRGHHSFIQLYAARGETEAFQIAVAAPADGLSNVEVEVSELTNSQGEAIARENITLYREHYVEVTHSSPTYFGDRNPPLGKGWYPDGLIPFVDPDMGEDLVGANLDAVPFSVSPRENQPIWVDIYVPRNTSPGEYRGTYIVSSNQGTTTGEFALKVWDFTLPLTPSLDSTFAFWEEQNTLAREELLRHKVMPNRITTQDQQQAIAKWGFKSSRLPFWSGGDIKTCTMKPAPSVEEIQEVTSSYDSRLFLYARFADEIDRCEDLIEPVKEWARNFHQAGVSTAIAMTPTPELYDDGTGTRRSAVDLWIVLPEMYDSAPERIAEVLAKGDRVWFYNALTQDNYSPKWEIDYAPINYRIPHSFINYSLGLTGMLYWRVDLWSERPWYDVMAYVDGDKYYPGEGMLVYPGKEVGIAGVAPSIRLKWIRDGVEDYEYLKILENLGQEELAREFSSKIGKSWKKWAKETQLLEEVRIAMGEAIEEEGMRKEE